MRVLAPPAVGVGDDGLRALEHDDRPPLLGALARGTLPVGCDLLDGLAGQARHLARVRRQDPARTQLALAARRVGQRVEAVCVDDHRALGMHREVDHEPPCRAVPAEAGADDERFRADDVAHHAVMRRVPNDAGRDLGHRRGHDLCDLGREDRVDRLGD